MILHRKQTGGDDNNFAAMANLRILPVRKSVFGGSKQKRWMVLSDHTVLSDHMLALEPRIVFHAVSAILIPTDSPF